MDNKFFKDIAEGYKSVVKKKTEKMDPVGQADADIDNDGDVDSSDEYLHKRRKAIKKSMEMDEKSCDSKMKKEGVDLDEAIDHEAQYDKHIVKHHDHIEAGNYDKAEYHAQKAEYHAKKHFEKTKKKIFDPGYTGDSPHITDKMKEGVEEQYVDTSMKRNTSMREALKQVWSEATDREKHVKGATKPEGLLDKESPKSKEFIDKHEKEEDDTLVKSFDDVSKAGRVTKQSPARNADQLSVGDKNPVK